MLAHISNDEHLKEAFVEGQDIHASTAMSRVFRCRKAEDVTPNMRRQKKLSGGEFCQELSAMVSVIMACPKT